MEQLKIGGLIPSDGSSPLIVIVSDGANEVDNMDTFKKTFLKGNFNGILAAEGMGGTKSIVVIHSGLVTGVASQKDIVKEFFKSAINDDVADYCYSDMLGSVPMEVDLYEALANLLFAHANTMALTDILQLLPSISRMKDEEKPSMLYAFLKMYFVMKVERGKSGKFSISWHKNYWYSLLSVFF